MLAKLTDNEEQVVLIEETGIQFLDFGLGDPKRLFEGYFVEESISLPGGSQKVPALVRLDEQSGKMSYASGDQREFRGSPKDVSGAEETLRAWDGRWLPLPFYRTSAAGDLADGPSNWVRCRVDRLPEPDEAGHLYRVTVAVDTLTSEPDLPEGYLAPTVTDVQRGEVFRFVDVYESAAEFALRGWVSQWIDEVWRSNQRDAKGRRREPQDYAYDLEAWPSKPVAQYLHLVTLLASEIGPLKIKLLQNDNDVPCVDTTLIVDIGNSRTCAIVLEKHPDQSSTLSQSYRLRMRDLGDPSAVYGDPFESRVEFSAADFGSGVLSRESGRNNAFMWPTLVRVGTEAARLAATRRGTEGATGVASPKRYLWDEKSFPLDWRFNQPDSNTIEPLANEGPMLAFIDEEGNPLCDPDLEEGRLPALRPRYSRSALTSFLITEILAQALNQMNSVTQRDSMTNSDLPRRLTRLVITLPPAMPIQEREILKTRARHAVTLLWQTLGYLGRHGEPVSGAPAQPEVIVEFDEATCAQVVWVYSTIVRQFGGKAPDMFEVHKRRFGDESAPPESRVRPENCLRVASIDIGGGTTDLVVSDFTLEGSGNNVTIVPSQVFREGFNIAGDDILKRVVQVHVLGPVEEHLRRCGVDEPTQVTRDLFGVDRAQDIKVKTTKRLAATQFLVPLGYELLGAYERSASEPDQAVRTLTISEILGDVGVAVSGYVNDAARAAGAEGFDINTVPVTLDPGAIHRTIATGTEINRVLEPLTELVAVHNCDVLLLTGRPSRLRAVVGVIKQALAIPADRVIEMGDLRTGSWYPFNRGGKIGDPKTTAAVGAMLCHVSEPSFNFRSSALGLSSTSKYLGNITDGVIAKPDDVYYDDLDFDNKDYQLPDRWFEFRGPINLGVRQLPLARWRAQMLYLIDYADEDARAACARLEGRGRFPLKVTLQRDSRGAGRTGFSEDLRIMRVVDSQDNTVPPTYLDIQLKTIAGSDSDYWLDSGHVKEM